MSTPITAEDFRTLIESSTRKLDVCVPCRDFYRRAEDWTEEQIQYVDTDDLLQQIQNLIEARGKT